MALSRRSIGAVLGAALLVVMLAPVAFAAAEDSFFTKLNAERTSRGLPQLQSHWDLVDDAEDHSNVMMSRDELHHNPNLGSVTSGWVSLGENVGLGPSVASIHGAFMNSSAHRANILGDYTHVGIGTVRESENKLWVTVVFMKAAGGSTTTTVAPSTTAAPPPTTPSTSVPTSSSVPTTSSAPPTTNPPTEVPSPTAAPAVREAATAPVGHDALAGEQPFRSYAHLHRAYPD